MNQDVLNIPSPEGPGGLRLRPTLVIGLGGTGHRVVLRIKALALKSWGAGRVAHTLKFLVFDTAYEALTASYGGAPVAMEVGTEFIDIGETPVAKIKRNLDRQAAIQERLGGVMASLPPTALRNGAKQLRPLGLLAFLWRYTEVEERLHNAIWELANRQRSEARQGINVFIVNSLVGGTGSSTFLDVAHLVRDLFDHLGGLADFCYITGVGVLPRAFHGIRGPNLVPNAVASLKELNHCMIQGNFTARYPNGRAITTAQPPFNIYYLLDGVDEQGHTWHGLDEVCRLAAEAIFLQMGSQVGQKQENDFDNIDDVLVQQTPEGDGTFCGSFGLASLVFSGPAAARACASRQAVRLIQQGLLAPPSPALAAYPDGVEGLPAPPARSASRIPSRSLPDPVPGIRDGAGSGQPGRADAVAQAVEDVMNAAGLDPAPLAERLARDDQGTPLSVDLAVPGWADRLPAQSVAGELVRYVRDYERARLGTDFKRWLNQNEGRLATLAEQTLAHHLVRLARQSGLPVTTAFIQGVLDWLNERTSRLSARQTEDESRLVGLTRDLAHLETAFLQAAEGGFLGRSRRVARAQQAYFTAVQHLYGLRWRVQVTASTLVVLNHVGRVARDGLAACHAVTARLEAVHRILDKGVAMNSARGDSDLATEGVTTRSLADEGLVGMLFERFAPPVADSQAVLFNGASSPLEWHDKTPDHIQAALVAACLPAFQPIADMSVEDAIALCISHRIGVQEEATPEGYYHWLMAQATPSWGLDRTRLPDGGAGLQRLEVLGVHNETHSLYRHHAGMLVSTGDPTCLVAFVARIGAPHTAIQGWDGYQAAYKRVRGHVPLHVLHQFQADSEHARQTFALAWLFGFITNQGSFFYYTPADSLERPVKLGQGLANALHAFSAQDGLVREAWERVEHVVASRGVEATLRVLTAYYSGDGRDRLGDLGAKPADDLVLELKRLVRAYADQLRQIHQFTPGSWPAQDDTEDDREQ